MKEKQKKIESNIVKNSIEKSINNVTENIVDKAVDKALGVAVASNGFESLGKISRDYSRSNIYTDIAYRNDFKGNQEFLARAGFTYYF